MAFLEPCESRRKLFGQLIVGVIWIAVTGFGIYLSPDAHGHGTHQQLGLPPCPSVIFFNRPCPGCGLTTSWTATIHGHFGEAFRAHPLGPFLYLAFTGLAVVSLWGYFKRVRVNTNTPKWTKGIVTAAVIFFTFGIVRFIVTPHYAAPNEVSNFVRRVEGR